MFKDAARIVVPLFITDIYMTLRRNLIIVSVVAVLFSASGVFAQTTTTTTSTSTSTESTSTTTQAGPALAAAADFVQRVQPGAQNAVIGVVTLDATNSNQPITLNSIPLSVSAAKGASLSMLTNCSLYSSAGTQLTTGTNAVSQVTGSNTLRFDTPLNIPATQGMLLVLRCSLASTAPVGGTLTFSLPVSGFQATSNGNPVTVTQGVAADGQLGTNTQAITIGSAQGATTTPGLPSTGAGGNAMTAWSILILSGIVAFLAIRGARAKSDTF
jgi:hypothetical protein